MLKRQLSFESLSGIIREKQPRSKQAKPTFPLSLFVNLREVYEGTLHFEAEGWLATRFRGIKQKKVIIHL